MWFGYEGENTWHPIDAWRAAEIQAMNEKGDIPETLTLDEIEIKDLKDVGINQDLEKMDKMFQKKNGTQSLGKNKGKSNSRNRNRNNKSRNRNKNRKSGPQ